MKFVLLATSYNCLSVALRNELAKCHKFLLCRFFSDNKKVSRCDLLSEMGFMAGIHEKNIFSSTPLA